MADNDHGVTMGDCNQFPEGSRQREICEGMANLPLAKINRYRRRWGIPPLTEKPEGAAPVENPTRPPASTSRPRKKRLGDRVEQVLSAVGVTEKRVTKWLGRPCGCSERKRKLNLFHSWTEKKVRGLFQSDREARIELEELLE